MKTPISVLILTLGEEANVVSCLERVRWPSEVLVVDSGSADLTIEVARSLGAMVFVHPFEGYAKQRNWALRTLPFSHD